MPRATAQVSETKRFDLESLPGGFVELRRMTFGQVLERQSMITMSFIQEQEKGTKNKVTKSELAAANVQVTVFEFTKSIVDHNLEDEGGRKLNLATPADIQRLDPRVGQEIGRLISKYNRLDEEEEDGDDAGN
jgi:hypothetical protein